MAILHVPKTNDKLEQYHKGRQDVPVMLAIGNQGILVCKILGRTKTVVSAKCNGQVFC